MPNFKPTEFYSDLHNELPGNVVNLDAVKQAVFNLLNTIPGERIFEPEIGVQIEDLLFEPNDPMFQAYAMSILNELMKQEPRIELEDVEVEAIPDQYTNKMLMKIVAKRVSGEGTGSAVVRPDELGIE